MIEFSLPTGDKFVRDMAKTSIEIRLYIWADKHRVMYTGSLKDDKLLIDFDDEKNYTLFFLTWEAKQAWMKPKKI